jgi:hypothetical protein
MSIRPGTINRAPKGRNFKTMGGSRCFERAFPAFIRNTKQCDAPVSRLASGWLKRNKYGGEFVATHWIYWRHGPKWPAVLQKCRGA